MRLYRNVVDSMLLGFAPASKQGIITASILSLGLWQRVLSDGSMEPYPRNIIHLYAPPNLYSASHKYVFNSDKGLKGVNSLSSFCSKGISK